MKLSRQFLCYVARDAKRLRETRPDGWTAEQDVEMNMCVAGIKLEASSDWKGMKETIWEEHPLYWIAYKTDKGRQMPHVKKIGAVAGRGPCESLVTGGRWTRARFDDVAELIVGDNYHCPIAAREPALETRMIRLRRDA